MDSDDPIYSDDPAFEEQHEQRRGHDDAALAAQIADVSSASDQDCDSVSDPSDAAREELIAHFTDASQASVNAVVARATHAYLSRMDPQRAPHPERIEARLLSLTNMIISQDNQVKTSSSSEKQTLMRRLIPWQIAQIMLKLHGVIRIAPSDTNTDREYDLLAMYQASGPAAGTYTHSEDSLRTCARKYSTFMTTNDFKEVMAVLREDAARMTQCRHRDLIAVNNGIFHYGTEDAEIEIDGETLTFQAKALHPFDPRVVFLSKCHIDYIETPVSPQITHPEDGTVWDVESWIREFYIIDGDEAFNAKYQGMPELIWEIIGAIIRPHVRWGKTAWFYSEVGNNGKGTLCALMRNLCGPLAHTSIPLSDFGKDFALEPLVRASAIIVDENDVGTYIDKAANLKAIVTNDVIQINRKHRMPIAYQFFGLMVQCLNEHPRVKDKSESFYRRQLFVPFEKSFTGQERRYIKDEYLQRTDVLQYVLWYCLHRAGAQTPGSYYEFSEPMATVAELEIYKTRNDPVRAFWEEFRSEYVWDLLPFTFLYDHYKAWMNEVYPSGTPVSHPSFVDNLTSIVRRDETWGTRESKIRPAKRMNEPEHLIHRYSLTNWMNPNYTRGTRVDASQLDKICRPVLMASYRGLLRIADPASASVDAAGTDSAEASESSSSDD